MANDGMPGDGGEREPTVRFLGDMERIQPQPGDVFVLTLNTPSFTPQTADLIRKSVGKTLGTERILVFGAGMKLGVVSGLPEAPLPASTIAAGDAHAIVARSLVAEWRTRFNDLARGSHSGVDAKVCDLIEDILAALGPREAAHG